MIKKTSLVIFTLLWTFSAFSQIFSEDFETGDLGVFTAFDLDNNTIDSDEFWILDGTWTNNPILLGNNATSTSNYANGEQPDNWMVSSSINLPTGTGITLYWNEAILGGTESYNVIVSTGNMPADFTGSPVYSGVELSGGPLDVSANLDAYAGQTVYIAFHHNAGTQGYVYIDDIEIVQEDISYDMTVSDIYMNPVQRLEERIIRGIVTNLAAEIVTSFDINYTIDGGAINTSTITDVELYNSNEYFFEHEITWTAQAPGDYTISVWASNINGNIDEVPGNDVIEETFNVVEAPEKRVLLEVFTSSTCAPCAYYNERTEPLFAAAPFLNNSEDPNSRLNILKYHVEIPSPGDPSVNQESLDRSDYYSIFSAPSAFYDGVYYPGISGETPVYESIQSPAIVEMDLEATYDVDDNIMVNVSLNSLVNSTDNYRLHIYLTNLYYEFDGQNGETYFKNAVRKMLTGVDGSLISNLVAGEEQNLSEVYQFNVETLPQANSFDLWNYDIGVVAFLQNESTKEVYQSSFKLAEIVSKVNEVPELSFLIYPNPSSKIVNLKITDNNFIGSEVQVFNSIGQEVYRTNLKQMLTTINTSNWTSGVYNLLLKNNKGESTQQIIVK